MLNQLLETIIQILTGWVDKFTSHAQHVEDKLDSLDQTASDIETNTEPISDIADNTGAVITPIQNIKSNTDSIKQSSQTSTNNTTAILNNISTLSTNTGRAAAYAQDCANNTLEIKDKVVTIASDTTQIRSNTNTVVTDMSKVYEALKWSLVDKVTTETVEGTDTVSFNTDLTNDLVSLEIGVKAKQDLHGYDYPWIGGAGKNKLDETLLLDQALWNLITIEVKPNTVYTCSTNKGTQTDTKLYLFFKDNGTMGGGSSDAVYSSHPVTITSTSDGKVYIAERRSEGEDSFSNYHVQVEEGSVATDWTPYKNICPIIGSSTITFNVNGTSELINLGDTYYGGHFTQDKDGHRQFEVTHGFIASYNGETINEPWISSEDVYSQGATPTTGAQVVYPLATPIEVQLTPSQIATIKGINTIITDGNISVTYDESVKHYLDKQDN